MPLASPHGPEGRYRLVQQVNISHPLLAQVDAAPAARTNDMHKAVLEQGDRQLVAYFIEPVAFGPNSEILLLHDMETPLLAASDFRVLSATEYVHSHALATRLLRKQ